MTAIANKTETAPGQALVSDRIDILQAIRALAALSVLLFHAGHAAQKYGGHMPLIALTNLGEAGVDLFFVLSGFVIMHATMGRDISCRDYLAARFRRIFLPYWPVGLLMAAVVFGLVPQGGAALRGWFVSFTLLPVGSPALNVAWTLQHEIVFYACVAVAIYSGYGRFVLALWCTLFLSFWFGGVKPPIGLQLIDTEFLMGIAAWAAWRSGQKSLMRTVSIALVFVAAVIALEGNRFGVERADFMAIAALFAAILPWLVLADRRGQIRVPAILLCMGDASYAIYLIHALPLLVLTKYLTGLGWETIFPIVALAGLAAGYAYHITVERPLLNWGKRDLQPKRLPI